MITWKGWGILTIVFAVIGVLAGSVVGTFAGAIAGGVVGGGLAAFLNYVVAKALGGGQVVIDPATQQPVLLKKNNSLFFIPMTWYTPILAAGGLFFGIVGMMMGQHDKELDSKYPGKAVFEQADDLINSTRGGATSHGNNPAAVKAAASYSSLFSSMQSISFEGAGKSAPKPFPTYCHLGKGGITFVCHVPNMRKYKDTEAKKALSRIAWLAANMAAKEVPGFDAESTLTVGLRGITSYGSIQQGKSGSDNPVENEDMEILYMIFDPANVVTE